jgi:uncharacterized membrane protein
MIYMLNLKDLIKAEKHHQTILAIILIIYILLNVETPNILAGLVDNLVGNVVVVIIALLIFTNSHPVVGVLSLIAAYELIKRSGVSTGTNAIRNFLESEKSKVDDFSSYNDFPVTLEEEVVSKMAPLVVNNDEPNSDFKPVLDDQHDAAGVDYEGVI